MSAKRVSYPDPKAVADFATATGLRPEVVVRDIVRIAEIFNLLDKEFLGSQAVLTGGMALRLFASTRVSIRDLDVSVVGKGSALTVEELERLLEYEDPQVTIVPRLTGEWTRRELYQAKPLMFEQRFNPLTLAEADSWISADVSLRGLELKPVPMKFIHGYPFALGVEDEIVYVMDPVEIVAEKSVAYGIYRLSKHLADLAYMTTTLPKWLGDDDWLARNADEIRRIARVKFDANMERYDKTLAKQGIDAFDDMHESYDRPERWGVNEAWNSAVLFHGRAAEIFTYDGAVRLVKRQLVPVLWPE
jgi:hypothetical protein